MKAHARSLLVILSSLAMSGAIAFVAFDILRDTTAEVRRSEVLGEITDKTRALHILTFRDAEGSVQSSFSQAQELLRSLDGLLETVESRTPREDALTLQLRESYQDLGPLIEQWFSSGRAPTGIQKKRQEMLASQIWMKIQFVADDTKRLRELSRSRLLEAQPNTGITIIALIALLAVTNGAIYMLSLEKIVRAQRALQENQQDLSRAQALARVGSWRLDPARNELRWSDESYRIAGIPIGTPLTYESFLGIVHPDDRDTVVHRWKAALEGEPYDIEHRFVVAGETRWAREQAQFEFDAGGKVVGAYGAFHDITESKLAEESLREAFADMERLHRLTMDMARSGQPQELYERLMDAAVEIMDAEFASLQLLHPERGAPGGKGELQLLAHRGFPEDATRHWEWVRADSDCTCGIALATGRRCDAPDLPNDPRIRGKDREVCIATGIRAVQTTPLIARDGRMLGAISTHWKQPREPKKVGERDWRMFDVLAQHAADLLERLQSEQALQESEQRVREIFRQLPAGVGVMDRSGRWLLTNPLMDQYVPTAIPPALSERMPHWRAWDAQGNPVPPEDWPGQRALRGEVVAPGLEMLFHAEDGQDVWMRVSAAPLHDESDRIIGATCVVQNIDAIKRAEQTIAESEQRFRSLVGIITDVPWVTGPAGEFVEPQPAWEAYTGQSWEQSRGFGWAEALHPEDRERVKAIWLASCESQTDYESRGRLWHAQTQEYRHFVARGAPLRNADGSVREWVGACTDVHEQKQAEEALRTADRRKNEFLATLAHELRNPLAPVRNAVQLFRLKAPAVPELEWARDVIERQMQQMTRLIDDLMDVSRISRGRIELKRERVALTNVVQGAVETSRPLIEQYGHKLTVNLLPQPIYLDADLTRLAQVFSNLLNNAAKYTDRGGAITLTTELHEGEVVVVVADSGIGIPRDELGSIFELFSQVRETSDRSQGGLGIGLSLARRLVEMHDGTIEAHSEGLGSGSEFVVRLPILKEQQSAAGRRDGEDHEVWSSSRRILIVDDNRDAADSLGMMLRLMGNEIRTAYDGEEAVEAARAFRPEVLLLDLGLPKLDGYEACRRIRKHSWGEHIVLIAVTGWGQDEDKRKTEDAGFDRHMIKPVDPRSLIDLIASLTERPERGRSSRS